LTGRVTAEEHVLRPGDALTIRARELRRWENRTRAVVRVLAVSVRAWPAGAALAAAARRGYSRR